MMRPGDRTLLGCGAIVAVASLVVLCLAAAAGLIAWRTVAKNRLPPGYAGSPQRGRELVTAYGCNSCHEIPGVPQQGLVGPSLIHIGSRSYLAGRIPNEPLQMAQWLRQPQAMRPGSAMPDLGVTPEDARDMAAYLATLK